MRLRDPFTLWWLMLREGPKLLQARQDDQLSKLRASQGLPLEDEVARRRRKRGKVGPG